MRHLPTGQQIRKLTAKISPEGADVINMAVPIKQGEVGLLMHISGFANPDVFNAS